MQIFPSFLHFADIFTAETFCYGDVLFRRRFVTGDVLLRKRFVTETFCMETFCRGDVLCEDVLYVRRINSNIGRFIDATAIKITFLLSAPCC
jgi:hypothetical protein